MAVQSVAKPAAGPRFNWAILAALLAFVSLFMVENGSIALPIFACLLLISCLLPARVENRLPLNWLLRFLMFGIVIVCNLSRKVEYINMFDTRTMGWFGEYCAAELTTRSWLKASGDDSSLRLIVPSALIMLSASTTPDDNLILYMSPVYICVLLFALRGAAFSSDGRNLARRRFPLSYGLALLCVLGLGGGISYGVRAYRNELTNWGMRLLGERYPRETGALSLSPRLTSTFGQPGALNRAMEIRGTGDFTHLRGVAFDIYNAGTWSPRARDYRFKNIGADMLRPDAPGNSVRVIRFLNNHRLVFAPLNVAGLRFPEGAMLSSTPDYDGPLYLEAAAPSEYEMILSEKEDFQGPLCKPPTAEERQRLLTVSEDIEPGVRMLAQQIGGNIHDSRGRMEAVQNYLISHHHYSLRVDMPKGDPVSRFLLEHKSAHCEYFASAAVILSRLLGIPSRYVIGYYAHEREGPELTVVRQRDAHAWAECWIEGQGWVVLDATPGDGRPDSLAQSIPSFTRFIERLQDMVTEFRAWLATLNSWQFVMLGAGILLAGLLIQLLLLLRLPKPRRIVAFSYTMSDAELASLYRQFERACRQKGLNCPAGQTWQEYLESAAAANSAKGEPVLSPARSFLALYNIARFGGQVSTAQRKEMRSLLLQMQR